MIIRRAFYLALFPAAVVLPAWLLVGAAVFGALGWQILGVILGSAVLFLAMLGIAGIIFARAGARRDRAVSWPDVALQAALYAGVIALGFFTEASSILLVVVTLVSIAAFWVTLLELVTETRRRVREAFASFEVPPPAQSGRTTPHVRSDGEYIVIETGRDSAP